MVADTKIAQLQGQRNKLVDKVCRMYSTIDKHCALHIRVREIAEQGGLA